MVNYEGMGLAYCHICEKGFKEWKVKSSTRVDPVFVSFSYGFPIRITRDLRLLQVTKGFCDATQASKKVNATMKPYK